MRSLPDGILHFLGRVDDTVKVRGFRVDLTEVERAILQHPEVRQAAVVASRDATGDASLLGFFVPAEVDPSSIFQTLAAQLSAYMVPSALFGLDAFPLTSSAKVYRVRLAEDHVHRVSSLRKDRNLSSTERRVSEVWVRTLGHGRFGANNSFFEVGGTSLTVFAMVHRLREAFELERSQLPVELVYRFPTVAELARCIDRLQEEASIQPLEATPILVTLRKGSDTSLSPLFVIASAGGTLGAYEKLARAMTTDRDMIGVRNPFNWGERDPSEGFQGWVSRYIGAIRERQPEGPYYLYAYSSAGAFGYEIARRMVSR